MLAMADKMNDVLKLTRAGRVAEATALLQNRGGVTGRREPPRQDEIAPVLDMLRPATVDEAWSVPDHAATGEPARGNRPGSFEFRIVAEAAGSLRYKLYVPKTYEGTSLPLVVMLHGCTQDPDDFAAGTQMNKLADELGLLVAYPEQRQTANASKCWNWFKPGDQRRDRGEPALIAAAVRQIARDVPVDAARIFVAGLSAGGAAAAIMAHEYPDLFAGACVHSGLACGAARDLPSALAAMRSGAPAKSGYKSSDVPTIVFHGTGDRTVSPANARQVTESLSAGASQPEVLRGRSAGGIGYTRTVHRRADGGAAAEIWMLEGAGHAWSGGSSTGSYTDPRGPDASREMMRFFLSL